MDYLRVLFHGFKPQAAAIIVLDLVAALFLLLITAIQPSRLYLLEVVHGEIIRLGSMSCCTYEGAWVCSEQEIPYEACGLGHSCKTGTLAVMLWMTTTFALACLCIGVTAQTPSLRYYLPLAMGHLVACVTTTIFSFACLALILDFFRTLSHMEAAAVSVGPSFWLLLLALICQTMVCVFAVWQLRIATVRDRQLKALERMLQAEEAERQKTFRIHRNKSIAAFSFNATPRTMSRAASHDILRHPAPPPVARRTSFDVLFRRPSFDAVHNLPLPRTRRPEYDLHIAQPKSSTDPLVNRPNKQKEKDLVSFWSLSSGDKA